MKNLTKLLAILSFVAVGLGFAACGGDDGEGTKVLTISSDKTTISNNGTDQVVFTVKYGDENVTSNAVIFNDTDKVELTGNTFSSETVGTYKFYAERDGIKSVSITITVEEDVVNTSLVLEADKEFFKPDGNDMVTFTVKYDGKDVTSEAKIYNVTDNVELTGNTYKSNKVASVILYAEYNGKKGEQYMLRPLGFYHRVAMFKLTADWCQPCYTLGKAIEGVWDDIGEMVTLTNMHTGDKYAPANSILDGYESIWIGSTGIPTVNYDFRTMKVGVVTGRQIIKFVEEHAAIYSCSSIKASSTVEDGKAKIEMEVWINNADEYFVSAILNENGIVGDQMGSGSKYTHNHVFRTNYGGAFGTSLGTLEGDTKTPHSFEFDLAGYETDNCDIMILVTRKENGKYIVDNSVLISANGGSAEYRFVDTE